MKKTNVVLLVVAIGSSFLAGCGDGDSSADRKNDAVITITEGNRTYAELSTNDVVVRCNGAELTKGEVERQIAFRLSMARMRPGLKIDERRIEQLGAEMRRTCDRQFILQELMKAYALSNGVTVTTDDRRNMRERIVKTYAKGGGYAKILRGLSVSDQIVLSEGVDRELWVEKGREKLAADNAVPVTDDDVAKRRQFFIDYNKHAKAVLAKTWAEASNEWKRATSGCPFEKIIAKYEDGQVEHVSAEGEWGDLKASDYKDDKELFRVLTKTPEGFIPPPFEGDNGLLLVKMLQITQPDVAGGRPEALYRLAKVHFELPEVWEPETDEQIRADLEKVRRREAMSKGMQALVNASKIEYPCGTNLFPRISSKRKPLPPEVMRRLPKGTKIPQ